MSSVNYGTYEFDPAPFMGLQNEPIFTSGRLDYLRQNVTLLGQLTGCNILDLKAAKESLVAALSTGFLELTVGNTGFNYAKPISISLQESKLTKILPYEVVFEAYQNQDFSQFYGILDPVDEWTFSDEGDRIVAAQHNVSAKAVKTDPDSWQKVKNFVDGRLNGFEDISLFFSGQTYILGDKSEQLNRVNNTYGVTENWLLSTAINSYDTNGCIVRPQAKVDWDGNHLNVSVNGSIKGGISGLCDTGYFTPEQATEFARQSTIAFKSSMENDYYGEVLREPVGYSYNVNTGANVIDFNFTFNDPSNTQTGNIIHSYVTSFNASKNDPVVKASIRGQVKYDSYKDIFLTDEPENESRFQQVANYFSGVDPFSIVQNHFTYFNSANLSYEDRPLDDSYTSININKKPFDSLIEYDYSYNNEYNPFGDLIKKPSISITCEHSIQRWQISETINSFCVQPLYQTLARKSISVNGIVPTGVNIMDSLIAASGWIEQYIPEGGLLINDFCRTGDNLITINKGYIIK